MEVRVKDAIHENLLHHHVDERLRQLDSDFGAQVGDLLCRTREGNAMELFHGQDAMG